MKPALHFPLAAANTPKVRFGNVSTQLSVPGSLTCSLSVIVKLGECSVALTALNVAILALGAGLGGGDAGGLGDGCGVIGCGVIVTALTVIGPCCCWSAGSYSAFPAWFAVITQLPGAVKVTTAPEFVHAPPLVENSTGSSDPPPVALTV